MPSATKARKKTNTKAEELKEEGNTFQRQGRFEDAYKKYKAAIAEDPKNPILWANRASASLALQDFNNAMSDASKASCHLLTPRDILTKRQAIELDPKSHKAHSRLAQAYAGLSLWDRSISAWTDAIRSLPPGPLSPENERLKGAYRSGLQKAVLSRSMPGAETMNFTTSDIHTTPWNVALSMEQELNRRNLPSSAFVMISAHKHFSAGMEQLGLQKQENAGLYNPNTVQATFASNTILQITRGILRDSRVFGINIHPNAFKLAIDRQMMAESQHFSGWVKEGPKKVKEEALKMKRAGNLVGALNPLSVTVRSWLLSGWIQYEIDSQPTDFFRIAIEVVEWGFGFFQDVLAALSQGRPNPHGETYEHISNLARTLLDEVNANPFVFNGQPITYAVYAFSWLYPKSEAHAALGWYHFNTAHRFAQPRQRAKSLFEGAAHYIRAANCRAADDERHTRYLERALASLWRIGVPLGITLPLCKRLRATIPSMRRIWSRCANADSLQSDVDRVLAFEDENRAKIQAGTLTMDSIAYPPIIEAPIVRSLDELF